MTNGDPNASIRVLIVDDSATARLALRHALETDPRIRVVAEVARGNDVLERVEALAPDLVTMDVYLGNQNGIDVAATLMVQHPVPILAVTSANPTNPALVYRAMAAGVLEVCAKLPSPQSVEYSQRRDELLRLVRALARVPVVRRHRPSARPPRQAGKVIERESGVQPLRPPAADWSREPLRPRRLLLFGASTGGPKLLRDILFALPQRLDVAIVIAQHITLGFGAGLASWFASETRRQVCLVTHAMHLERNAVYLPPDGRHVEVRRNGLIIPTDHPNRIHTPCVDVLFESAARSTTRDVMAVLLTGMGSDGALGLKALHEAGATTIAQEPSTCVAEGMPRSAIELGAVRFALSPAQIIEMLAAHCGDRAA